MSHSLSLPLEVEEFLRAYGTEQTGRPLPRRWRRRRARTPGDCYAQAGRWCVGEPVMYTEGRALSGGLQSDWMPFAWLTAKDGGVIDLGCDDETSETIRYFGVRIPTLQVVTIARGQQSGREARRFTSLHGPVLPELIRSGWTPI